MFPLINPVEFGFVLSFHAPIAAILGGSLLALLIGGAVGTQAFRTAIRSVFARKPGRRDTGRMVPATSHS